MRDGGHTLPETLPEPEPTATQSSPAEPRATEAALPAAESADAASRQADDTDQPSAEADDAATRHAGTPAVEPTKTAPTRADQPAAEANDAASRPDADGPAEAGLTAVPDSAEETRAAIAQELSGDEPKAASQPEPASEPEAADQRGAADGLETAALAGSAELETAGMRGAGRADAAIEAATRAEADTAVLQPLVVREARQARLSARETVRIAWPERVPAPPPVPEERPFWMPVQEMPRGSQRPPVRVRPGRSPKSTRRPAAGLIALLVFALLATFFAWVSAEPLWLAVGHSDEGTATVTECTGDGMSQRCLGEFTAADGAFTAERVRLLGVGDQDGAGTTVAARMVGSDSGRAYVDAASDVIHLRWGLGMGLVLLCGIGIVWATGSLRLESGRARRRATLAGLAGPLLVAIAFLAATF